MPDGAEQLAHAQAAHMQVRRRQCPAQGSLVWAARQREGLAGTEFPTHTLSGQTDTASQAARLQTVSSPCLRQAPALE